MPRSRAIPSCTLPSGLRGCRRRVSENLRISASSAQSKNPTSSWWPSRRTSSRAAGVESRNRPSRASTTMASRCTSSLVPWLTSSSSFGSSITGRLSMQKNPRSSSALVAVDFPAPDNPVTTTMRCVSAPRFGGLFSGTSATSLHLVADPPGERGLRDLLGELFLELLRRVVPLEFQQVVARGHLDDGGQVAPRPHRDDEERHLHVEHGVLLLLDAEPVVLDLVVPLHQLHHHLHLLPLAHGADAEEVLDVDDADSPDLHVVLDDLRAAPVDAAALLALQIDDVVGHQSVAARDEVERQLALADAALAQDEHAHADDVDEHAVHRGRGGERLLEELLDVVDEGGGEVRAAQERHARVGRLALHPVVDRQVLGHHQASDGELEEVAHALHRLVVLEGGEVADLRIAEHLKTVLVDVLGEAAQGQPRLLDARADHAPVEPVLPGEELQPQIEIAVLEELLDLDPIHRAGA